MKLSTAKDKVLKSLIEDKTSWDSVYLSNKLNIPHYLVTAAMLDLGVEKKITWIEVSGWGVDGEKTYIVENIEGLGKQFYHTKSHRVNAFWKAVIHVLKNFWVVIVFIVSLLFNLYQLNRNSTLRKLQTEKQKSELQLKLLRDSLLNLKK